MVADRGHTADYLSVGAAFGERSELARQRLVEEAFVRVALAELNEICENLGYTPEQLVVESLKGQIDYWNEFYEHVMTLPVEPEDLVWPKDTPSR